MSKSVTVKTTNELAKALADNADEIRVEGSHIERLMMLYGTDTAVGIVASLLLSIFGLLLAQILVWVGLIAVGILFARKQSILRSWSRYKVVEFGRGYQVMKRR